MSLVKCVTETVATIWIYIYIVEGLMLLLLSMSLSLTMFMPFSSDPSLTKTKYQLMSLWRGFPILASVTGSLLLEGQMASYIHPLFSSVGTGNPGGGFNGGNSGVLAGDDGCDSGVLAGDDGCDSGVVAGDDGCGLRGPGRR